MGASNDLSDRLFDFAVSVLKMIGKIPNNKEFDVIKYQLSKSSTSMGANYEESQATTRKEFPVKIRISLREALESKYWLRIIKAMELILESRIEDLINDCTEYIKILRSILNKFDNRWYLRNKIKDIRVKKKYKK